MNIPEFSVLVNIAASIALIPGLLLLIYLAIEQNNGKNRKDQR